MKKDVFFYCIIAKAKGLVLELSACLEGHSDNNYELLQKSEQFLKEI